MKMVKFILLLSICISCISFFNISIAFGPVPLQDFCVADPTKPASASGLACANPALVKADDFFFRGFQTPGNTTNPYGAAITPASITTVPGLNTLGISMARLDFAPKGVIPPHTHPRATEIITVLQGSIRVGFVTSNPTYNHLTKLLLAGDVFAVPPGLVHYQFNAGKGRAVAIAALNSENPGIVAVPNAVFGAHPDLDSSYLAKSFFLDETIVKQLLATF